MPLLENITRIERSLTCDKKRYKTVAAQFKKIENRIKFKKKSLLKKYKKLKRMTNRHSIEYPIGCSVILEESKRRSKSEKLIKRKGVTEYSIAPHGTKMINKKIKNDSSLPTVETSSSSLVKMKKKQKITVMPIFQNKTVIFKHALDRIIKEIAIKRLIDESYIDNFTEDSIAKY